MAEFIAKLIIKRVTGHTIDKVVIESEKQLKGINMDKRGIRMDLCVSQIESKMVARIYDIEPNAYRQSEIFFRSRFYQSHADSKFLDAGDNFYNLPEYISIWILSYDPFGEDRMIYHVKNMVEENPALCYNDGTAKIYLYTGGKIGGTEELKALLKFFDRSTDINATDEDLKKLLGIVDRVKGNEKVGEQYMVFKSSWDYEFEEELAREVEKQVAERVGKQVEEAREEALVEGIISTMRKFKATDEQIVVALVEECGLTENKAREKLVEKQ